MPYPMKGANRRNIYAQTRAQTAGPAQRVLLIYDGIVKNINIALQSFDLPQPEGYEQIHLALSKADQLLTELKLALDFDASPVLAAQLDELYSYWQRQISEANVNKEPGQLAEVSTMVGSMREAWQQASSGVTP